MAKSFSVPRDLRHSDITPEADYREFMRSRREFLSAFGAAGLALAAGCAIGKSSAAQTPMPAGGAAPSAGGSGPFAALKKTDYKVDDKLSSEARITGYNNYYEFGTGKDDPARNAGTLKTRPWSLTVGGLVHKPMTLAIDDLLKLAPLEERIYRFRCVEGWSLVVPWVGYSLSELLKRAEPRPAAKYAAFETLHDLAQMPLTRRTFLKWPYREGLRLDEAMHPLTLLCTGLYGKPLPPQNGAPVRIIVPWKYGFKSCKSLVKITLVAAQPYTTWNDMAPGEYGFYSNVNPEVDHPRWSQKTERRVGEYFPRPTLMFNGYAGQVAGLYAGMDLKKNF